METKQQQMKDQIEDLSEQIDEKEVKLSCLRDENAQLLLNTSDAHVEQIVTEKSNEIASLNSQYSELQLVNEDLQIQMNHLRETVKQLQVSNIVLPTLPLFTSHACTRTPAPDFFNRKNESDIVPGRPHFPLHLKELKSFFQFFDDPAPLLACHK